MIDGSWPRTLTEPGAPPLRETGQDAFTDTNHLAIADAMGNMVSVPILFTEALRHRVVVDGVGVNTGNASAPRTARPARVSPFPATMLLRDGKPAAIGSPGFLARRGHRPREFSRLQENLYDSVDAPRFQGNQPTQVSGVPHPREGAERPGRLIASSPRHYNRHFGSMQAVMRDEKMQLIGIADPRRAGHAVGY
jgi:gamma-glutamyltranspeptidase